LGHGLGGIRLDGVSTYAYWATHFKVRTNVVFDCEPLNAEGHSSSAYRVSLWAYESAEASGGQSLSLGSLTLPPLLCNQSAAVAFQTSAELPPRAAGWHLRLYVEQEFSKSEPRWRYSDLVDWPEPFFLPVSTVITVAPELIANKTRVREFYHAGFDHYFVTASRAEAIAILDNVVQGWHATGYEFGAISLEGTLPELPVAPVCRFFSTSFAPKSSHFYTPDDAECDYIERTNPNWMLEARSAFGLIATTDGTCPKSTIPLFRLYNNGKSGAPNHRLTTSPQVQAAMQLQGWVPEGLGPKGIIACVPGS
jgi:hypothetical protein